MHAFKARLLEVVGDVVPEDLPDSALVEIIIARLTKAKAEVREACDAMLSANLQLEDARNEIRNLRNNPLALAQGDFYFTDGYDGKFYTVTIGGRSDIRLIQDKGIAAYQMQRLSPEEYFRRTKERK